MIHLHHDQDGRYSFKNEVTQRVCYNLMPLDQRRDFHLQLARILESKRERKHGKYARDGMSMLLYNHEHR